MDVKCGKLTFENLYLGQNIANDFFNAYSRHWSNFFSWYNQLMRKGKLFMLNGVGAKKTSWKY